jgi:hypothetical protein
MLSPDSVIVARPRADRLVEELGREDHLPVAAIREALAHWDEVAPRFLEVIEGYVREPQRIEDDPGPILLIAHLFAQQRDTRAYRPLLALVSLPGDAAEIALGDAVTETLARAMASVFDGDPEPLERAILDANVDEYVRCQLFYALAFLTGEGRIPRGHTRFFLERCYRQLLERGDEEDEMQWVGWQRTVSYLGLAEYGDLVRDAFRSDRIGEYWMSLEDFEADLAGATAAWQRGEAPQEAICGYFGDVVESFSRWYGFTVDWARDRELTLADLPPAENPYAELIRVGEAYTGPDDEPRQEVRGVLDPITPYLNPLRHVGRNDPCPCGSGRKYKKCCLTTNA